MDCENCRHLKAVGLHDTGRWAANGIVPSARCTAQPLQCRAAPLGDVHSRIHVTSTASMRRFLNRHCHQYYDIVTISSSSRNYSCSIRIVIIVIIIMIITIFFIAIINKNSITVITIICVAIMFVCWLLNVPATCECISRTDLHRQFYVLSH